MDRSESRIANPAVVAVVVAFRLAVVVLVLLGTKEIWRDLEWIRLAFMTNQAGWILAFVMGWAALAAMGWLRRPPAWLVSGITTVLVLVFVVATYVLPPGGPGPALPPVIFGLTYGQVMHIVLPAAAMLAFLLLEPHRRVRWHHAAYPVAYFLAYVGFVLLRAQVDGLYPYPILDPGEVGWDGVVRNTVVYSAALGALALAVVALDRVLPARALLTVPGTRESGTASGLATSI